MAILDVGVQLAQFVKIYHLGFAGQLALCSALVIATTARTSALLPLIPAPA